MRAAMWMMATEQTVVHARAAAARAIADLATEELAAAEVAAAEIVHSRARPQQSSPHRRLDAICCDRGRAGAVAPGLKANTGSPDATSLPSVDYFGRSKWKGACKDMVIRASTLCGLQDDTLCSPMTHSPQLDTHTSKCVEGIAHLFVKFSDQGFLKMASWCSGSGPGCGSPGILARRWSRRRL